MTTSMSHDRARARCQSLLALVTEEFARDRILSPQPPGSMDGIDAEVERLHGTLWDVAHGHAEQVELVTGCIRVAAEAMRLAIDCNFGSQVPQPVSSTAPSRMKG